MIQAKPEDRLVKANKSKMQMQKCQAVYKSNWNEVANESSDEEEMIERMEMELDQNDIEQQADVVQVAEENALEKVLKQLKIEPKEDSELQSKFSLYEDFLQTVEESRKATFDYWKDVKPDFEAISGQGNAVKQVKATIKNIDKEENL